MIESPRREEAATVTLGTMVDLRELRLRGATTILDSPGMDIPHSRVQVETDLLCTIEEDFQ